MTINNPNPDAPRPSTKPFEEGAPSFSAHYLYGVA